MTSKLPWKTAWVTGASSGLGRAIAVRLAEGGCRVAASARSLPKLEELSVHAEAIATYPLDVRDREASLDVARRIIDDNGVPDLVLLNAGIGKFRNAAAFDATYFQRAVETNLIGIGNALETIIPAMVARGSGHIALMGSLAGYRGIPFGAHYAPTKAAVRSMAECLRCDLEDKGITVTLISPGYVETPLTSANDKPMPGLMPLGPAIDRIMHGLHRRKFEIAFPWHMALWVKLGVRVPNALYFPFARWTAGDPRSTPRQKAFRHAHLEPASPADRSPSARA